VPVNSFGSMGLWFESLLLSVTVFSFLQLLGHEPRMVWQGDGLDLGVAHCTIPVLIVGFLTTAFYVIAFKSMRRKTRRAQK